MASQGRRGQALRSGRRLDRQRQEAHGVAGLHAQQHRLAAVRLGGRRRPRRLRRGASTGLPPASRITSPACRPRSAATPSGSTSATATPSPPRARSRLRPSLAKGVGFLGLRRAPRRWPPCPSAWRRASRRWSAARRCARSRDRRSSAARARRCGARDPAGSATASPLTAVMTSPTFTPAFAAGESAVSLATSAPEVVLEAEAVGDVRRHRLDFDAEPAARDLAIVLELLRPRS